MISSAFVNAHHHLDKWSGLRGPRRAASLAAVVLLVLSISLPSVIAHPYDPGYYSLRSALRLDASRGLELMAVAEVPNTDMLQAFVDRFGYADEYEQAQIDGFIQGYFDVFAKGLSVEVQGAPFPGHWEPVDDPRNGRVGEQGLFVFMLRFVPDAPAPLEAGRLEVQVHVESFAGANAFFSGTVEALEPWRVSESSARELLGEFSGGADVNECFECWSRDESLRHSRALFERSVPGAPRETPGEAVTQP